MDGILLEEKSEPIEEFIQFLCKSEERGSLPFEGNMLPRSSMNM